MMGLAGGTRKGPRLGGGRWQDVDIRGYTMGIEGTWRGGAGMEEQENTKTVKAERRLLMKEIGGLNVNKRSMT
jgi:hypothetical protein